MKHYAEEEAHDVIPHSAYARSSKSHDDVEEGQTWEAVDLADAQRASNIAEESAENLESLLHWAIEQSDPERLSEQAAEVKQKQFVSSLGERKKRVQELINIMSQQPSETQLLKEAIAQLSSSNSTDQERHDALVGMQMLVEPIDNANDLHPLGGLEPLVGVLGSANASLRASAAYVLGTAASNNAKFQHTLLSVHPDIFVKLMELVLGDDEEAALKGLYATAALVRNSEEVRKAFLAADGVGMLMSVMMRGHPHAHKDLAELEAEVASWEAVTPGSRELQHIRSKRKALSLILDLLQLDKSLATSFLQKGLPHFMASLLHSSDPDLEEKALDTIIHLADMEPSSRQAFQKAGAEKGIRYVQSLLTDRIYQRHEEDHDTRYFNYLAGLCEHALTLIKGSADHSEL